MLGRRRSCYSDLKEKIHANSCIYMQGCPSGIVLTLHFAASHLVCASVCVRFSVCVCFSVRVYACACEREISGETEQPQQRGIAV